MSTLFALGRVVSTPGVLALFENNTVAMLPYLQRHEAGDWGDLDPEDVAENGYAVENGFRLLSAYEHNGQTFWIITEADRSATTFLLPDEY